MCMSAERDILEYLNKERTGVKYHGVRFSLLGLPDFKYYRYQTLANNFSVLSKRGFIKLMKNGEYIITTKGKIFLEEGKDILRNFKTERNIDSPKDMLIIYDIEEKRRRERKWFRLHLKKFHFVMIQKSVWVGPSPLPKDFLDYLKEIKLGDNLKIFKLSAGYVKPEK